MIRWNRPGYFIPATLAEEMRFKYKQSIAEEIEAKLMQTDIFDKDFGDMLVEYIDRPVTTKLVEEIVDKTIELLKSDKYKQSARVQYLRQYWLGEEVKRYCPDNPERRKLYGLE